MLRTAIAFAAAALTIPSALAADLGGSCCNDLEERIAELEATTARKGNTKVSLTISGQISKALIYYDFDDESDVVVSENSAAESYVAFDGVALVGAGWRAGFTLKIGVGEYEEYTFLDNTNGIYTREAALFLEANNVGRVSLGLLPQATDGIAEVSVANTGVVARTLSLRPLNGPQVGEVLDIYDGTYVNGVRFDSSVFEGFRLSASWANGEDEDEDDVWDIAVRYANELGGFRVAAGVGYRVGTVVPTIGKFSGTETLSGSASVMHIQTGLFLTAAAGRVTTDAPLPDFEVTSWHAQGGIERKWFGIGATTLFVEYGEVDIDGFGETPNLMGVGFVQAIDAAAMDLFINLRKIEVEDGGDDAMLGSLGARIRF